MDQDHTLVSQIADDELNAALEEEPLEAADPDALWHARIAEYEAAGLEKPNSRTAALIPITAGLIGMAGTMQNAIKQSLAGRSATIDDIERLERCLNLHLRTTRQVERLINFEARADAAEMEGKNARRGPSAAKTDHAQLRPGWPR